MSAFALSSVIDSLHTACLCVFSLPMEPHSPLPRSLAEDEGEAQADQIVEEKRAEEKAAAEAAALAAQAQQEEEAPPQRESTSSTRLLYSLDTHPTLSASLNF